MSIIERLKSKPMLFALAALVIFVILQTTGADVSEAGATLLALMLPVLVGFGIINDPATHATLFANGEQKWYQSVTMWTALAALIVYCVRLFLNYDAGPLINGLINVLMPVLMALGIVKSPTSATSL